MSRLLRRSALAAGAILAVAAVRADTASEVRQALGLKVSDVLSGTVLTARVLPGEAKQIVSMTTCFTGKKDEANGVDVRLDVFRRDGKKLVPVWSRDYGKENGGYVGRGEVQLVDLDGDGVSEIVVTYEDSKTPLVQRKAGEVVVFDRSGFRVAWSGDMEYDATRAARDVPQDRRDRFVRTLDVPATVKTRGITLFSVKKIIAVAGERLPAPREVRETFPLKPQPEM